MLGRRRRRRANINLALGQCIVFAGSSSLANNESDSDEMTTRDNIWFYDITKK